MKKVQENKLEDIIDYCEFFNKNCIKNSFNILFFRFSLFLILSYLWIIMGVFFSLSIAVIIGVLLVVLAVLWKYLSLYSFYGIFPQNKISNFLFSEILNFSNLSSKPTKSNFSGNLIFTYNGEGNIKKELQYKNGFLHGQQLYCKNDTILFETTYDVGNNIGPFIRYKHEFEAAYTINHTAKTFIMDINGNKYNEEEISYLMNNMEKEFTHKNKKIFLSKNKTDIFNNLMTKLNINLKNNMDFLSNVENSILNLVISTFASSMIVLIFFVSFKYMYFHQMPESSVKSSREILKN
ncbi:hypothetical protein [Fusobacterium sp. PH5-29]|uniref:hypothetical protein n=1 Tax=Fusobacterium sp. PH5-29 TaxID=1742400 RepID=UPI003D232EF8